MPLRTVLKIWLGLLLPLWGWAQPEKAGLEIASKLGLCDALTSRSGEVYESDPCANCNIEYIPLVGSRHNPDLLFIEINSASHCGSGGCSGQVYARRGPSYQQILGLFGYFERSVPQPGNQPADLVYLHVDSGSQDYDGDGMEDRASIWIQYRWNSSTEQYLPHDILRIKVNERSIPLAAKRTALLREWTRNNRWSF
ncbi:hypothetical protein [Phaeodactylibacter sp.]|jgi:hypothetical protein|uniref:hypothetical protein n=2 Tax=Phaeodactylibacter sp. TaxID=1940289 RepID=UPI0025E2DF56|nr:hypothetical protein [Phaeodactylibacter sp.]MCI5094422.1 hypothetical protein [Phaeodactylibacter sp.]